MLKAMKRGVKFGILAVAIVLLVLGLLFAKAIRVPKPQIASAQGKPAPDFTLKNQDGNDVTLSSLRGSPILLIFYRGYW
jgi:cytochrome oxidase Cu insertion factor (SCO1/SenC/PrrC family)